MPDFSPLKDRLIRKPRGELRGSGIGKFLLASDAFTPEAEAEIQQMFDDEIGRSAKFL